MYKNLSAKYYQENKETLQKKAHESYQIQRRKRKRSNNMVVNIKKISQKMRKINWLSIEKNIIEREKMLYYNYKKVF